MVEPSLSDAADEDFPEPPRLRALRLAVMGLTVAAAVAVLAVAAALVVRAARPAAVPAFDAAAIAAESVVVPAGEAVTAAGAAPGVLILITRDADGAERLRFYDARTGRESRVVAITRGP